MGLLQGICPRELGARGNPRWRKANWQPSAASRPGKGSVATYR